MVAAIGVFYHLRARMCERPTNDLQRRQSMRKVLVLVPFPLGEEGVANRRAQLREDLVAPDMSFTYKPVTAGPALYDSGHDLAIADVAMLEAGMDAEDEGYAAVCIDTMSDSGMVALRSVLDIPV